LYTVLDKAFSGCDAMTERFFTYSCVHLNHSDINEAHLNTHGADPSMPLASSEPLRRRRRRVCAALQGLRRPNSLIMTQNKLFGK